MNALFFTVFFVAALAGKYIGYVLLATFLLVFFALLLVPIMLVINGIVMMKKETRSLGNLLSLLLGLVIGAGEIAFLSALRWKGILQVMSMRWQSRLLPLLAPLFFILVFGFLPLWFI